MKTILIYPPKYHEFNAASEISRDGLTLGIAYISAYLNQHGYYTDLIDAPYQGYSCEYVINFLLSNNYDVVGISMSIQEDVPDTIALAEEIKKYIPSIFVFVGGHFATQESEAVLQNVSAIDYIVHGEGEITSLNLIKALSQDKTLSQVKSISFREKATIYHNTDYDLIEDLDSLPLPIHELSKISKTDETRAYIAAQRGCYSNCSFCSISSFYRNKIIRRRSPSNIAYEIEQYYTKYDKRIFKFIDDTFACATQDGKDWILEFCQEIKKRNLFIKFEIQLRATDCKIEILKPLIDVGLDSIGIGIESFSDRVLERLNKDLTVDQILESIRIADNLGLKIRPLLMLFEPDMTFDELSENFNIIKSLKRINPFAIYNFVRPFSGTPLRAKLIAEQRLNTQNWYDTGIPVYSDSKVQMAFQNLMKTRELFILKQRNDVSASYAHKILLKYLELGYEQRKELCEYFISIYELTEQKTVVMTSASIEIMDNILSCLSDNNNINDKFLKEKTKKTSLQIKKLDNLINEYIAIILATYNNR